MTLKQLDELDESADKLVKHYKDVYVYVLGLLEDQINRGLSEFQSRSILREIQLSLREMDDEAYKWTYDTLPEFYYLGLSNVDKEIAYLNGVNVIGGSSALIHKKALEVAINDFYKDLAKNTTFMLNQSKRIIRDNAKEFIDRMIVTGESQIIIKKELRERLIANGVTSFVDAGGKEWLIENYADMAIRTKSRILHTEGTLNRLLEYQEEYQEQSNNFDLIQISSHGSKCWCGNFENKVFSISGKSDRYPPISMLPNQPYRIFHPKCKHIWLSYIESIRGEGEVISPYYLNKNVNQIAKEHYHLHKK